MFTHRLSRFEQAVYTIHPGEYLASAEDVIIATVLGSCISVAFWDHRLLLGGINHFMLPGDLDDKDVVKSRNAKYGMFAMEMLYNDLLKKGSHKIDISAKVFGGASVLKLPGASRTIPKGNTDFAFAYLEKEGIPVLASDTGGVLPRKIFFFARTGKVLLKRIGGSAVREVEREEVAYLQRIGQEPQGQIVLFDK
jgi:chemotaxis protein CheD